MPPISDCYNFFASYLLQPLNSIQLFGHPMAPTNFSRFSGRYFPFSDVRTTSTRVDFQFRLQFQPHILQISHNSTFPSCTPTPKWNEPPEKRPFISVFLHHFKPPIRPYCSLSTPKTTHLYYLHSITASLLICLQYVLYVSRGRFDSVSWHLLVLEQKSLPPDPTCAHVRHSFSATSILSCISSSNANTKTSCHSISNTNHAILFSADFNKQHQFRSAFLSKGNHSTFQLASLTATLRPILSINQRRTKAHCCGTDGGALARKNFLPFSPTQFAQLDQLNSTRSALWQPAFDCDTRHSAAILQANSYCQSLAWPNSASTQLNSTQLNSTQLVRSAHRRISLISQRKLTGLWCISSTQSTINNQQSLVSIPIMGQLIMLTCDVCVRARRPNIVFTRMHPVSTLDTLPVSV